MNKFWTVTDSNTEFTNSRSKRFTNVEDAIREATLRIEGGRAESVYILESVKLVKRASLPVIVENISAE